MKTYFFIGIGGSGMSAIAQLLLHEGHRVLGSDRSRDQGRNPDMFHVLENAGAALFPQNGSGVSADVDYVVVSTAIEDTVPDMKRARELSIPVLHRAELLAEIFNAKRGVAVGGTSGKSTVTGMIGYVLYRAGLDPSVINGGKILDFVTDKSLGNTRVGGGDILVVESDESDGSIVRYKPAVGVVTNVTKDHKPIPELRDLFETFLSNVRELAVIGADCAEACTLKMAGCEKATFSINDNADFQARDIRLSPFGAEFTMNGLDWKLKVPGAHNVLNALAAAAVCRHLGVEETVVRDALAGFGGIARRYNIIGRARGVTVIDDFAHNPDKIRATLETLALGRQRRLLVFQAHGFAPTFFMKDELIEVFTNILTSEDVLYFPEIHYAGGTAQRNISMADIADALNSVGRNVVFRERRSELITMIAEQARDGDVVAVMGARDDTLTDFCRDILAALES